MTAANSGKRNDDQWAAGLESMVNGNESVGCASRAAMRPNCSWVEAEEAPTREPVGVAWNSGREGLVTDRRARVGKIPETPPPEEKLRVLMKVARVREPQTLSPKKLCYNEDSGRFFVVRSEHEMEGTDFSAKDGERSHEPGAGYERGLSCILQERKGRTAHPNELHRPNVRRFHGSGSKRKEARFSLLQAVSKAE